MKNLLIIFVFLGLLVRSYSQNVGIGSTVFTPDASAMFEVRSTEKGILIPRMTTSQRNAISNPANSLLIFNIDTRCFEWWDAASSQWISMGCACPPPPPPMANAASSITQTAFTANWTAVSGATGYFLDVATDNGFTNFVPGYNNLNVGNVISYNVTGLTCNTTYYYLVRAVNVCGTSANSNTITVTTSACPVCFSKQFGGAGGEYAYSIIQTSDGGYAVAGWTYSFGAGFSDFWVLKLASDGTIQWQRTYGGSGYDGTCSIIQTSDGGYAVAGHTNSFGAGFYDIWVLKLASDGTIQWQRTYGGTDVDEACSIIQTSDGGYAVAGNTVSFGAGDYDFWVLKLGSDGTMQWQRSYGGENWDYAYSIIQTSDGGYSVAGYTRSFSAGEYDFWVLKLGSDGTIQWQRSYGGSSYDEPHSIIQTSDGGYSVAGQTNSFGAGNYDFWVIKLNSSGLGPGCGANTNATVQNTNATVTTTTATITTTTATAPTTSGTTQVTNCTVSNGCPCP